MSGLVLASGALVGLGGSLAVIALFPAPPALGPAMERLRPGGGRTEPDRDWRSRLARKLSGTVLGARAPRADLALLGKTADAYLTQKGLVIGLGVAAPVVFWAWCALLGVTLPWVVSWTACAAFAVAVFFAPDIAIRSQAAEARTAFRQAIIAYLDLVALARAAGAGPADSLESAAKVGQGWTFQRLALALDPARRTTGGAWDELTRLSEEIRVPELADLAAIAQLAGTRGAGILDTLMAKAQSLREADLSAAVSTARSRTETMTVPMALSVIGFLLLLGYPAFARMTGG
ncbi:type II secretion system F family protein [Spongiactinospora sp. TRM90649]|uniref:type II secretion system F family protein n=1 Tax=Spongiactinospora sp. TRM90649 TaxID=3031114 RepID=UPI0023F92BA1|nr:type II secretion system F family protein [Spongiactinospora sp. TRM90649]MDF5759049.1 type II secretion system F family protein [Spongiactinospora sp. TRM90649]